MIAITLLSRSVPALLLFAAGCAQLRAASATPPMPLHYQLEATRQEAEREVLATRHASADRLLADFAARHAGSPEATEAGFWRAVYMLDTANQTSSALDAVALLDAYLASSSAATLHRGAATSLRRAAVTLDRPMAAVDATPSSPGTPGARAESRPDERRDEEIQRLKEELAKANAELERIRRRLAQPNP
jgi:hypothetical protein